jgi:hypothetical protein
MSRGKGAGIHQWIILAVFVIVAAFTIYLYLNYPAAIPAEKQQNRFSAERAYKHLEAIAQQPRRMFTPYYNQARDYLISELKKLGLEPELQSGTAHHPSAIQFYSAVENIVVRIEGSADTDDAVLLVGHFDSEPFVSHGVIDDGTSIAVMVEIARLLKTIQAVNSDVILLFSVPEEPGVQGVTAFITHHPWAQDVKFAINIDGISPGKMALSSTSAENGILIQALAQAAPQTLAFSSITGLDTGINTDFGRALKPAGYPGFDFYCLMNSFRTYHSRLDNLDIVDMSSLQYGGASVYSMIRHFGNMDLNDLRAEDRIFFNILNGFIIHYPKSFTIPLVIIMVLLLAFILYTGFRRRLISISGLSLTILAAVIGIGASIGLITLLWNLISTWFPMYQFIFNAAEYNSLWFYIAFSSLAMMLVLLVFYLVQWIRKINQSDLLTGIGIIGFLISIGLIIVLPGMSYLPIWITLFLLVATAYVIFFHGTSGLIKDVLQTVLFILSGLVTIVVVLPLILVSYGANPTDLLRYVGVLVFITFLLPVAYPALDRAKLPILAILALAIIIPMVIALTADFTPDNPRLTYVSSIHDADSEQSVWLTQNLYESDLDDYSAQFVREGIGLESVRKYFPNYPYDYEAYFTPVSIVESPVAPELEVTDDSTAEGVRTLQFRITSPENAWEITAFKDRELEVLALSIDDVPCKPLFGLEPKDLASVVLFHFRNIPSAGITVTMQVNADSPVTLQLRERRYGLPQVSQELGPMPETMIPWIDYGAHSTYVIKTFELPIRETTSVAELDNNLPENDSE